MGRQFADPKLDSESIRQFLVETAIAAGKEILDYSTGVHAAIPIAEGLHGIVTEADLRSNEVLVTRLSKEYPSATVISEETRQPKSVSDLVFVVDPLDGTNNYCRQLPYYSISIACRVSGETVIGIVYDVTRNTIYSSAKGKGIRITRVENHGRTEMSPPTTTVSKTAHLGQSIIVTGWVRGEEKEVDKQLQCERDVLRLAMDVRRFGAASLDLISVALGQVDGYYETNLGGLWDILGGALIVGEAGGACALFEKPDGSSVAAIATNGLIHESLWDMVKLQFDDYELCEQI